MKNTEDRKIEYLSRTGLVNVLKQNIGKRCTISFKTIEGEDRTYNGLFNGHMTDLGYWKFLLKKDKENNQVYKQFDGKKLLEVRVNKTIYKLKK